MSSSLTACPASLNQIWRRALDSLSGLLLFITVYVSGFGLVTVALACLYTLKRAAGLDLVPGIDMLPDDEIEAAIRSVLDNLF